jgi:hypothetical protein
MIVSASALAANIAATAKKLGTALPGSYVAEIDSARRVVAASGELDGHTEAMHAGAMTALRENRDPGADPNVVRLATLVTLANSGIRHYAVDYASDIITTAIAAHADTVLAGWGQAIAGDLHVLMNAAEVLDVPKLDDADPRMLKRANHLGVWADATTAADRADLALVGVRTLLTALHANTDPEYRVLMLAPECSLNNFIEASARTGPRDLNAWTIARTGAPLRLVTSVTEFTEAAGRITAARQQQQAQADAEEAEAEGTRRRNRTRTWQPAPR